MTSKTNDDNITAQPKAAGLSSGPFMTTLSLVLAFMALILSGYELWQVSRLQQQRHNETQQTRDRLQSLQNTQQTLAQQAIQDQHRLQDALQEQGHQPSNWLLYKTQYLLELAQLNAQWSEDYPTTLALLQQADGLLAKGSDPALSPVREALAHDLAELQTFQSTDEIGIITQLQAEQAMIARLPLSPNAPEPRNARQAVSSLSWRKALQQSLTQLKQLVIVRHHDEAQLTRFVPTDKSILLESAQLNLQLAQAAVLRHNQSLYALFIDQALQALGKAFDPQQAQTQAVITALTRLRSIELQPAKPLLSDALPRLKTLLQGETP